MIKYLLIAMIPFSANADWVVKENSTICLTYEALNIAHRKDVGLKLNDYELVKMHNDCSFENKEMFALPQSIKSYTKVELMSYENKRKIYFINTRDLRKR